MISDIAIVYMTCAAADEADGIVRALLERHLIACANIMPQHRAVYRWNGAVTAGDEVAVIMKTRAALVPAVRAAVAEVHSYDVPCILSWDAADAHPEFAAWVAGETEKSDD